MWAHILTISMVAVVLGLVGPAGAVHTYWQVGTAENSARPFTNLAWDLEQHRLPRANNRHHQSFNAHRNFECWP